LPTFEGVVGARPILSGEPQGYFQKTLRHRDMTVVMPRLWHRYNMQDFSSRAIAIGLGGAIRLS
jgi:hypothetical protein